MWRRMIGSAVVMGMVFGWTPLAGAEEPIVSDPTVAITESYAYDPLAVSPDQTWLNYTTTLTNYISSVDPTLPPPMPSPAPVPAPAPTPVPDPAQALVAAVPPAPVVAMLTPTPVSPPPSSVLPQPSVPPAGPLRLTDEYIRNLFPGVGVIIVRDQNGNLLDVRPEGSLYLLIRDDNTGIVTSIISLRLGDPPPSPPTDFDWHLYSLYREGTPII